jgi:hypothetical protein
MDNNNTLINLLACILCLNCCEKFTKSQDSYQYKILPPSEDTRIVERSDDKSVHNKLKQSSIPVKK